MAILDHLNVGKKGENMKLTNKELKMIEGGAGISGTLINSLIKGINSILDIGRYFGSSFRRLIGKNACPLN